MPRIPTGQKFNTHEVVTVHRQGNKFDGQTGKILYLTGYEKGSIPTAAYVGFAYDGCFYYGDVYENDEMERVR